MREREANEEGCAGPCLLRLGLALNAEGSSGRGAGERRLPVTFLKDLTKFWM